MERPCMQKQTLAHSSGDSIRGLAALANLQDWVNMMENEGKGKKSLGFIMEGNIISPRRACRSTEDVKDVVEKSQVKRSCSNQSVSYPRDLVS